MNAFDTSGPSVILSEKRARSYFPRYIQNTYKNMPPIALKGSSKSTVPDVKGPKILPVWARILKVLKSGPMKRRDLISTLEARPHTVTESLRTLKIKGQIRRGEQGWELV